jgi:predicted Zn finger-like uncharacterized protein
MPIAVTCSGCQADYSLADHLAGKKVRCKKCGQILVVPDASRGRGEEDEVEAGTEEPGRHEEVQASSRPPQREDDRGRETAERNRETTIYRTLHLADLVQIIGLFLVALGCWAIYAGAAGWERTAIKNVLLVFVGVVCLVPGTACVFLVGRGVWRHFAMLRKKERFIIGRRKLEWVVGEDELLGQFPYDNIAEVRLKGLKPESGPKYHIIGITFIDRRRKDTFAEDDSRKSEWEEAGFDYAIWDVYDVPIKTFYQLLKQAWEEAQSPAAVRRERSRGEAGENEERPPLPAREGRPRRKRRIVGLVPLLVLGPALFLGLVLALFVSAAAKWVCLLSLVVWLTALVMAYRLFKKKGLQEELDATGHEVNPGMAAVVLQINYAFRYPRLFGCWVGLEVLGMIALIVAGVMAERFHSGGNVPAAPVAQAPNPGPAPPPGGAGLEVPRITGDPEIDRLLAGLDDESHPWNRIRAANHLAQMKPNEHRAAVAHKLAEVATGANEFGRGEAIKALAVWATANELPDLLRLFRQPGLRHGAGRAIRTVGPAAEKDVAAFLNDPDPFIRGDAIDLLKDIGTRQSMPALQAVVDRNDGLNIGRARDAIAAIQARAGR